MGINFFIKLVMIIKVILEIDNWHIPLLHYFDMRDNEDVVRFRNGTKCIVRNKSDATAFFEIFFLKTNTTLKNFAIRKNDIIIDIGAHVGFFTIYAARQAPKGKIYAFEPYSKSFNFLRKNIEMNKLGNVITENCAVLKNSGTATLFIDRDFAISNTLFGDETHLEKETVTTISMQDIFDKYQIRQVDLLKLDCEGAEFEIILNLSKNILGKIVKISAEIHQNTAGHHLDDLSAFLKINNFNVEYRNILSGIVTSMPMLYATNKAFE
ncbi:MAG: FkbM family methyltransferase [Nitrosopumilaceae archaeon]